MTEIVIIRGTRFEVHGCITCGVIYTLPETVANHQRQHGGYHHCSNGHSQGWSKGNTEIDRLRRERDRLVQNEARLIGERDFADEERAKAERALSRHKKRAAAGTCPCCKRTFKQLASHMKQKHPDFGNVVELKKA